ncbi:MAG: histidine phosphatase family protein [Desulfobacterales bacterium]
MESITMCIYLVRHGETEWNKVRRFQGSSNLPLNQEGRQQVRALALALKNLPLTAIYTETFEKCSFLFKFKEGENFNRRNTLSILRIEI